MSAEPSNSQTAVTALSCRSCGGALDFGSGSHIARCSYCGAAYLVIDPTGVLQFYYPARQTDQDALRCIYTQVFLDADVNEAVKKKAVVRDVQLLYVPFVEHRAKLVTKKLKRGIVEDTFRLHQITNFKEDTEVHYEPYARYEIGCDFKEILNIPIAWVREFGESIDKLCGRDPQHRVRLFPYDIRTMQQHGLVFNLNKSLSYYIAQFNQIERDFAAHDTIMFDKNMRVLYYPLWRVVYDYQGDLHTVYADGLRANIIRASAPERQRSPVFFLLLTTFMLGFAISLAIRHSPILLKWIEQGVVNPFYRWLAIGTCLLGFLGSIFLLGMLSLAWTEFRYTGKVIFERTQKEIIRINKPPQTFLERLLDAAIDVFGKILDLIARTQQRRFRYWLR
jgi:hypothetical protein